VFASAISLDPEQGNWRWQLVRFGEKLFRHNASRRAFPMENRSSRLRAAEEARHRSDVDKLAGSYHYSKRSAPLQSNSHHHRPLSDSTQLSAPSIYSQMTGVPRRTPEPRQPVKGDPQSRFSSDSMDAPTPYRNPFRR
jgi:hypothetical protein